MPEPVVTIDPGPDALAERAAALIAHTAAESIAARGRFTLALAGGSTPEKTYAKLAARRDAIPWYRTRVYFSDERLVPHDDPRSNYGMAARVLFGPLGVPGNRVVAAATDWPSAEDAARHYGLLLRVCFEGPAPRFDLILLGLGADGHTASLFPGAPALSVRDRWVVATPPGTLPPPVDRITFTFPVLNAARRVAFLVAGAEKAAVVHRVLSGAAPVERTPAAGVRPDDGELFWLLDAAAAGQLNR